MKQNSKGLIAFLFISVVTWSVSVQADVESVSGDRLEQVGDEGYWQAEVRCEGNSNKVEIRQALKGDQWCAEDDLLPCRPSKLQMANAVCQNIELFARPVPQPRQTQPSEAQRQARRAAEQAAARQRAEREAAARQRSAAAARDQALEVELQRERAQLEREKLALQQEELELEARSRQIEELLEQLDE